MEFGENFGVGLGTPEYSDPSSHVAILRGWKETGIACSLIYIVCVCLRFIVLEVLRYIYIFRMLLRHPWHMLRKD